MGVRLRKSGNANVVTPSPPYMVPSSENNACCWLIDISAPLQLAIPLGAKLNPVSMICPRYVVLIGIPPLDERPALAAVPKYSRADTGTLTRDLCEASQYVAPF